MFHQFGFIFGIVFMVVYRYHRQHRLHMMYQQQLTCLLTAAGSSRAPQTQPPMSYCSWSILWKGRNQEGQHAVSRLMHCSGVNFCVGAREIKVIQFSNAKTYDATYASVSALADWVRGDVSNLIQPATDAEVAMASAAAATAQADTVEAGVAESRDTPPPAGDATACH